MRIIHSFITYDSTSVFKKFCNILCMSLSCLYLKQHKEYIVVLYADKKTIELVNKLNIPYDEINEINQMDYPKNIYAYPKFIAMQNEPLDSVHIDCDVFLKGNDIFKILSSDVDVIAQSKESLNASNYDCWFSSQIESKNVDFPKYMDISDTACINHMINCGVIAIKNKELKDLYFKNYWNFLEQYKIKYKLLNNVPELIFEQRHLLDLCEYKNYSIKYFFENEAEIYKDAVTLGYQHLLSGSKFSKYCITNNLRIIKKLNKDVYNNLKKYYKNFSNYFNEINNYAN